MGKFRILRNGIKTVFGATRNLRHTQNCVNVNVTINGIITAKLTAYLCAMAPASQSVMRLARKKSLPKYRS